MEIPSKEKAAIALIDRFQIFMRGSSNALPGSRCIPTRDLACNHAVVSSFLARNWNVQPGHEDWHYSIHQHPRIAQFFDGNRPWASSAHFFGSPHTLNIGLLD